MGLLKKLLIIGLSLVSFSSTLYAHEEKFVTFLKEHNKHYNSVEEYHERYNIFKQNLDFRDKITFKKFNSHFYVLKIGRC
jgi:hypothetical protein